MVNRGSSRSAASFVLGTLLFVASPVLGQGRTLADWQRDLRDPAVDVRARAVQALVTFDRLAVPELTRTLDDKEYNVRASTAEALAKMVPGHVAPDGAFGPAVPALARALRDPNLRVRELVKIAILSTAFKAWHPATEGFRDGLGELGYTEGRSVHLEVRAAEGDTARLPALARELVGLGPALFYCVGSAAATECARAAPSVPLVFVEVSDPVRRGLAKSLSGPGGNVTGIANLGSELAAKRLELFKGIVPSLRRVLVTYDPREAEEQAALVAARRAAGALGLTLLERPITSPPDMEPGLAQLKPGGRDGILIVQFAAHLGIAGRSLEVATSNALPTMYPSPFWTTYGALASYGADQHHQGRQAARLAHRILTGTPPSALPVELPDRVEFTINRKVATRLGLSVPGAALLRADRVIE